MDLVNQTGLAADLMIGDIGDAETGEHRRTGCLVAKATFKTYGPRVELDADDPLPVLDAPLDTALGLLPSDVRMRQGGDVEFVLLGSAHAPGRRPVESMTVSLQIGDYERRLSVIGDRYWIGSGAEAAMSPPEPFLQMPLTWDRAFGGSVEVWLDEASSVPLEHPFNSFGRGADPAKLAARLAPAQCAPTFPRYDTQRLLPNLENPASPIQRWDDEPLPYCWSTLPGTLGLRAAAVHGLTSPDQLTEELMARLNAEQLAVSHPELRGAHLPAGSPVRISGCTTDGVWEFVLPRLRVGADYVLGERMGRRELDPTIVVLLPEERRFSITYQAWFRFTTTIEGERSLRLTIEDGR